MDQLAKPINKSFFLIRIKDQLAKPINKSFFLLGVSGNIRYILRDLRSRLTSQCTIDASLSVDDDNVQL